MMRPLSNATTLLTCLLTLVCNLVTADTSWGLQQEPLNNHEIQNVGEGSTEPPKNRAGSEFVLRFAFHHDTKDYSAPPDLIPVDTAMQLFQVDGQGQPHRLGPLTVRSSVPGSRVNRQRNNGFDDRPSPDVTDRETVINMAKMTSDAYVLAPSEPDWLNTSLGFNHSYSFGWRGDGLRGHVFTDQQNETIILAIKGTSIDPRNRWQTNDRVNDNILFSCCCGDQRPDPYPYGPVCSCRTATYQCNSTCLTQELIYKHRYYPTALAVTANVTAMYPNATSFWLTGHSMGGAIASLVGMTHNYPSVTFEAPPQRLPAQRLGLTIPPQAPSHHFGNTADPIFMGACNGWSSSCGIAGYAFESQCFTGKRCVYDTVGDKGWHLNIGNHRINTVIAEVLEKYDHVAECEEDEDCFDCYNWNFNVSSTTSSVTETQRQQ